MPSELRSMRVAVLAVLALALRASSTESDGAKDVVVSMNKVWPFSNPTETYKYYDFPFCQPEVVMPHFMTLGQVMRGDRLVNSIYKMHMKRQVARTVVCNRSITDADIQLYKAAIDANYMFELFVGNLPIDRPIGVKSSMDGQGNEGASERYFLVNYLDFIIGYNNGEVVSANVTRELNLEHLVDITDYKEGMVVQFSYSVHWASLPHIEKAQE